MKRSYCRVTGRHSNSRNIMTTRWPKRTWKMMRLKMRKKEWTKKARKKEKKKRRLNKSMNREKRREN